MPSGYVLLADGHTGAASPRTAGSAWRTRWRIAARLVADAKDGMVAQMQTQNDSNKHRDHRGRWILLVVASLVALILLLAMAVFLSTVPKPWRVGIRDIGTTCTQSFGGSPESQAGASIKVSTDLAKTCGYAYAVRTEGRNTQYLLTLADTEVDAGSTVLVTLTSYDGWRRQDRVRRSIQGPARLHSTQMAADVSPRTTLVEVVTSMRGGGGYAMRGVTLHPSAKAVPSGVDLYREAADVVAGHALQASNLPSDFRARWQPAGDATPGEARRAIKDLLKALGDGHSFLMAPDRLVSARSREQATFQSARFKLLGNDVGYVEVPGFRGSDPVLKRRYSTSVAQALHAGSRAGVRAWVVDLRGNTGGNMWPMLAGLEPLLRDQPIGWSQQRDGRRRAWHVEAAEGAGTLPDLARMPVAVLTSERTASAGEAVVVAFRGRPHTRSFGAPTAGLATGNTGYRLQDGTMLHLTTTSFVDRLQIVHVGPIQPDERAGFLTTPNASEAKAVRWLEAQITVP